MLDCCRPLEDVKRDGITLPQAACLARCNGARVELHRHGSFTLEEFRREVGRQAVLPVGRGAGGKALSWQRQGAGAGIGRAWDRTACKVALPLF